MNKLILQFGLLIFILPIARAQDGANLAEQAVEIRKQIESGPPQFSLIGKLERGHDSEYAVNNEDFIIDSETRINGTLRMGESAMVRGDRIGNRNYAKKIVIEGSSYNVESSRSLDDIREEVPAIADGPAPLPGHKPLKD